jgi:hypothetical protein
MICDAQFRITNCVAKWPGSVHDSRIFRDSHISVAFEDGMLIQMGDFQKMKTLCDIEGEISNWTKLT